MRKIERLLAVVSFLVIFAPAKAQNIEIGGLLGGSYYYGDVVNELNLKNVRYSFMGFLRYHVNDRFVLRGNLAYVRILGLDSVSKSSSFQRNRNLNFFSDIYEVSAQAEYNLVEDRTRGRKIQNRTIPYIFGGIGFFYFNPQTVYLGNTYNLAQLQTSGISYSQVALCIPLGVGVRYYLTPRWLLGFEFAARITSTSDLDDIRGNSTYPDPNSLPSDESRLVYDRSKYPKNPDTGYGYGYPGKQRGKVNWITDTYFIYGITLSYKFGVVGGGGGGGKLLKCPRFF